MQGTFHISFSDRAVRAASSSAGIAAVRFTAVTAATMMIPFRIHSCVGAMPKTVLTKEPRIMFAVPIVHNNTVRGCVFASTEQDFFEEKIFGEDYSGITETFLIDKDGTIDIENLSSKEKRAAKRRHDNDA